MTDNIANLRNYQIQLQQVDQALINDPDDEELKLLQKELNDVIRLTKEVMDKDELAALESMENNSGETINHNFKAGDYVLAPLSEDGQFYEAQVEDITSDGQCTVVFSHKRVSEVCLVELLKPLGKKRQYNNKTTTNSSLGYNAKNIGIVSKGGGSSSREANNTLNSFKRTQELREAQKRKQQKRKDKLQLLEEEREKDKMKWQSFASKVSNKKLKGSTKRSIFASPETVNGRVGVGTCGLGGKPMTEYTQQKIEKTKKTITLPKLTLGPGDLEPPPAPSYVGLNRNRF